MRVKDITLKRISNNNINTQMITNIINQIQIQQIFTKLTAIEEFQTYQIETDRNSRMIRPFLDARDYAIKAENTNNKEKKIKLLEKAEEKVTSALNEVYLDLNTTKDEFIKSVKDNPGLNWGNNTDKFMKLLLSDIQLITKYTGVKMQLLEYLGDNNISSKVLEKYLNTASPTGFEQNGQQLWCDYISPFVDKVEVDYYGTAYGIINPKAEFKVVIEAHADVCKLYYG